MSLEHSPARATSLAVANPSYTPDEFCRAERISKAQLYKDWNANVGPDFYWNGNRRRITHRARLAWQRKRERQAKAAQAKPLSISQTRNSPEQSTG